VTERRPVSPGDSLGSDAPRWDPGAIGEALDISPDSQTFPLPSPTASAEDTGLGLVFGDPPRAVLELYPSQRRLQLRVPGLRLELDGIDPPTIGPEGVVFERTSPTHALWLSLGRSGELALHSTPVTPVIAEGPSTAPDAADDANRPFGGSDPERPVAGHPTAREEGSDVALPATEADGKEERQERVKVFGRLATDVRFKARPNGRLIGEFVLTERLDEEHTRWHKVAAFDNPQAERFVASKLRQLVDAGELGKGRPASVVGYVHRTERQKRDGTTTTEEQIYAVAISPR
jgi:Single-strand binding protein family